MHALPKCVHTQSYYMILDKKHDLVARADAMIEQRPLDGEFANNKFLPPVLLFDLSALS